MKAPVYAGPRSILRGRDSDHLKFRFPPSFVIETWRPGVSSETVRGVVEPGSDLSVELPDELSSLMFSVPSAWFSDSSRSLLR